MNTAIGSLFALFVVMLPFAWQASTRPASKNSAAVNVQELARAAVNRAVPLLQNSADTWLEKKTCASCHHQGLGEIAVALVAERGFIIDTARLQSQARRTLATPANWLERYVTAEISTNEAIGQSYRAIGAGGAGYPANIVTDAVAFMLAGRQHASGRWLSYSRRPPLEDSEFTATAVSIRALQLFAIGARKREFDRRIVRARTWLAAAVPQSMEDRVMQMLGLAWAGGDKSMATRATQLLAQQQADGGWSQISTRGTDVYATAQALVALNQAARIPMRDARMQKGLRYLTTAQQSDGSWHVPTRRTWRSGLPYFESGYPHGKDQFISYAGAAWATMALALSVDDHVSPALMGHPKPFAPIAFDSAVVFAGITPLMRAAMFGTANDVRQLLAAGASVSDTSVLRMTPIMFAAHDAAKTALLLAAGANPNAEARQRHTAMYLAASYDGASASVDTLLAHNAVPNRALAGFTDFSGMTAAGRSAVRGDTVMAARLLKLGASGDSMSNLLGTALQAATYNGDAPIVRWLLARGAPVNGTLKPDAQVGETPLMAAAEDGMPEVVRVLIAGRANVNFRDAEGQTALHYAALTFDRGDTRIVDLLLAAGADRTLVTKDSATAQALAAKWGKPHIAARLGGRN